MKTRPWQGVEKLNISQIGDLEAKSSCLSNARQDVQKGPSSKAAGSEEAEAYKKVR